MVTTFQNDMEAVERIYRDRGPDWVNVSDETADSMLGAVPPICFPDGFACWEAHDFRDGHVIRMCFRRLEDRYIARLCSLTEASRYIHML